MKMTTLAGLRKNAGYTQDSFARALNITTSIVSKWEQGVQMPSYSNLRKIKILLGCNYDSLLS